MSHFPGAINYQPPRGTGTVAHQESHSVTINETQGTFVQYTLVIDGGATKGSRSNPEEYAVAIGGYTVANGALQGGRDDWNIEGGIVEQFFTDTSTLEISLDGQAVSPMGLVNQTGGTHPSNASFGCSNNVDCEGDLVCENGQCAIPQGGLPQCSTGTDCQGDLVCDGGQCALPPVGDLPQCESNNHCAGDLVCQNGRCVTGQGGGGGGGMNLPLVAAAGIAGAGVGMYASRSM